MSDEANRGAGAAGATLAALRTVASSSVIDRLALRGPLTRLVGTLSAGVFRTANGAARAVATTNGWLRPERPARVQRRSDLFDPNPTEEQRMLRDAVRDFAENEIRPLASGADEACATPRVLLDAAWGLGLAAFAVPEALGGAGGERSPVASALVAEELARGDMGIAVAILAPIGVVNALASWGTGVQQDRWLRRFTVDHFVPAALAIAEPTPLFDPSRLSTKARRAGDGYVLDGVKALVPHAADAELFLIAAQVPDEGPGVFVVEAGTPGMTTRAEPSMGVRAAGLGRIELDGVRLTREARLGDGLVPYDEIVDLSRIGWAALAAGSAQAVLDYVIPYVNDRTAFGEPISHRQSVAFLVANIAVELEAIRMLELRAASRAEQGLPYHREAFLARTLAAEKGMEIGSSGVQLLGGHGFVKEHPVERWYRDLRAIAVAEGGVMA